MVILVYTFFSPKFFAKGKIVVVGIFQHLVFFFFVFLPLVSKGTHRGARLCRKAVFFFIHRETNSSTLRPKSCKPCETGRMGDPKTARKVKKKESVVWISPLRGLGVLGNMMDHFSVVCSDLAVEFWFSFWRVSCLVVFDRKKKH